MPRWGFRHDPEGAFWSKVDKSGGDDACWEWKAAEDRNGYGVCRWQGKKRGAHTVAFEITHGRPAKPGLQVCHRCHNRLCCNPRHLYEGTRSDNMRDMVRDGRFNTESSRRVAAELGGWQKQEGPPGTAWCAGCKDHLPVERFSRNKAKWNGYEYYCKECRKRVRKSKGA